jgi:hypothetical protein
MLALPPSLPSLFHYPTPYYNSPKIFLYAKLFTTETPISLGTSTAQSNPSLKYLQGKKGGNHLYIIIIIGPFYPASIGNSNRYYNIEGGYIFTYIERERWKPFWLISC